MAFNIWKLHCKNVDLTIVIQLNILLLLLSLIYCTFSFIPIILSRMFIPLFNAAAAAYGSSLWHKYGNHEQGGHIKSHFKNKYLATHLVWITQQEQQIFSPSYSSCLDHLSIFFSFVFLLFVAGIELSIQIPSCWLLQNTEYTLRTQNTVVIITEATKEKVCQHRSAFTVLQPKWTSCHKANSKIHNECCNWALMFLRSSQT